MAKPTPAPKRVTRLFLVDADLLERVRNAVASLAGQPEFLSMREFVDAAFLAEVKRLEKRHNSGRQFAAPPKRAGGRRPAGDE